MSRPRNMIDAGWSGDWIHSEDADTPPSPRFSIEIEPEGNEPLLYVEQDGERMILWRKGRVGFV